MKRAYLFTVLQAILMLAAYPLYAQTNTYQQQYFSKNLNKVFESGRKENFESINGVNEKESAFLPVPGYSIHLQPFNTIYVDKDNRFVGKTGEEMDSLSAIKRLDELLALIGPCLDSTWQWREVYGNDSTTPFFKEIKELRAATADLELNIAMVQIAPNLYTANLYIRRKQHVK